MSLPSGLSSLGSSAFASCTALKSISIPNGITSLSYTFYGCSSLESVKLPDKLAYIYDYTFYNCASLKSIAIPDGVMEIRNSAFEACTSLASVKMPESLTLIGYKAFTDCTSLTEISLPDGFETLEDAAFADCSNLATVSLGQNVVTLGGSCFNDCEKLAEITLPASLREIGHASFNGCEALMTINCLGTTPSEIDEESFDTKHYLRTNVYIPRGTLDDYIASSWGNFANLHDTLDPSSSGIGHVTDETTGIYVVDGKIMVEGFGENTAIEVYNLNGQLVYRGYETSIITPCRGIYIVKAGDKVMKVTI